MAQQSDVVFSIVGFPKDGSYFYLTKHVLQYVITIPAVRDIALGPHGVLFNLKKGSIYVDMTTSEPSLAQELDMVAASRGVHSVDAPVSGGDVGAREARLSIMIGGEPTVVAALRPLFELMGKNIVHMGPAGSGQHTKMVNQILIATNMVCTLELVQRGCEDTLLTSTCRLVCARDCCMAIAQVCHLKTLSRRWVREQLVHGVSTTWGRV